MKMIRGAGAALRWVMLALLAGTFLPPAVCRAVGFSGLYSFKDDFSNGSCTDAWTVTLSGQASVRESGTLLDVAMSGQPDVCAAAAVAQKQTFGFPCAMDAVVVLRPAAGASAGVKLGKDANNFVELVIGPDEVVINNMETGRLASQVVGRSAALAGMNTTVKISAFDFGAFTFVVNNVVLGAVTNTGVGSDSLSLKLSNGYCPSGSATAHNYYDSVEIKTFVCFIAGRLSGRVTDSRTGAGIPHAGVAAAGGGAGMTSPNGYYVLGLGVEPSVDVTVAAEGYSPASATVAMSAVSEVTFKDWSLRPVCPSAIDPEAAVFEAAGGVGSVAVTMAPQAGCGTGWLAETGGAWIYLPGGSGIVSGSAMVPYLVASNAGTDPRIGTISLAGRTFRIVQGGTGRMASPVGSRIIEYAPVADPFMSVDPASAHPFAAGNLADGEVDMDVGLPGFTGPVDIYLGFRMPDYLSNEIWIIMPDLSVRPASQTVAPWKAGVTGPVYEGLYEKFSLSQLPAGRYDLYTLVTPAGRLDAYYLWATHFIAP